MKSAASRAIQGNAPYEAVASFGLMLRAQHLGPRPSRLRSRQRLLSMAIRNGSCRLTGLTHLRRSAWTCNISGGPLLRDTTTRLREPFEWA